LEFYLFKEMIRPFFLGVAGGAVMMLGNQLFIYADLLVKKRSSPSNNFAHSPPQLARYFGGYLFPLLPSLPPCLPWAGWELIAR
jgi:hypothetical protein